MTQASAGDQLSLEGTQPPRVKKQSPRVPVEPDLLIWARERAGFSREDIVADVRFKKFPDWEEGNLMPTLSSLEAFAKKVRVPLGYLFLQKPPKEAIPIKDFRTPMGKPVKSPSPELLDTIYVCQRRQSWYRHHAISSDETELDFVGSATINTPVEKVATEMRAKLGFDMEARRKCKNWEEASRFLIRQAEAAGVLVMVSGVAKGNPHRPLNPDEFRGFALSDTLAPLIFINAADTKAAQIFTLAHELAHLWLGDSVLSNMIFFNSDAVQITGFRREEVWCNAVAADFLASRVDLDRELLGIAKELSINMDALLMRLNEPEMLQKILSRLITTFRISKLVILRRLLDMDLISRELFRGTWDREIKLWEQHKQQSDSRGGDFHKMTLSRVSRRFAKALIASTLVGKTHYRDAYRMLGISKTETLKELGRELGVTL